MVSVAELRERDDAPVGDQVVFLHDVSWDDYERLLAIRGDRSAPRIAYLEGTVEIMTPSRSHEALKSWLGRLVETYCEHAGIEASAFGSWTLRQRREDRGVEPDECYVFGPAATDAPDRPHLAIEVIWTTGGIDKLEIYRRLGIGEVWIWRHARIQVHALRGDRYEAIDRSEVLPGIDLVELVGFLDRPTMTQAVRDYRPALAARHA